jgi:carbonic anhydrase
MRNGTIKESKYADSLWRQAPDIKRTLKAGGLRVIGGANQSGESERSQALLDWAGHERDRRSSGSKRNLLAHARVAPPYSAPGAGGIVTDDSLRSLLISHYLLDTEEIMVINHTDCGLMHTSEQELRTRIQNRTGTAAIAPAFFFAFQNIEENVRSQLQKLHTHPWIPKEVSVRGFVYDVSSGRLREINRL